MARPHMTKKRWVVTWFYPGSHGEEKGDLVSEHATYEYAAKKAAKDDRWGIESIGDYERRKNPIRRIGLKKGAKAYVNRPSQITGAAPSARLKKRRKAVAKAPDGYFPNPTLYVADYDALAGYIFKRLKGVGRANVQIIREAIDEWMLMTGRAYHETSPGKVRA